ncbi:hypothetical protein A3J41_02710 [candidate division TM6 bacterium RIFCSPHIGHO2_12_FULL_38_8]|nr:MAG: hypothetical protein A3J41_02710 [candidate division TM6 bacterium RIFCSPHIGHO2_12_FULL_38_8]
MLHMQLVEKAKVMSFLVVFGCSGYVFCGEKSLDEQARRVFSVLTAEWLSASAIVDMSNITKLFLTPGMAQYLQGKKFIVSGPCSRQNAMRKTLSCDKACAGDGCDEFSNLILPVKNKTTHSLPSKTGIVVEYDCGICPSFESPVLISSELYGQSKHQKIINHFKGNGLPPLTTSCEYTIDVAPQEELREYVEIGREELVKQDKVSSCCL